MSSEKAAEGNRGKKRAEHARSQKLHSEVHMNLSRYAKRFGWYSLLVFTVRFVLRRPIFQAKERTRCTLHIRVLFMNYVGEMCVWSVDLSRTRNYRWILWKWSAIKMCTCFQRNARVLIDFAHACIGQLIDLLIGNEWLFLRDTFPWQLATEYFSCYFPTVKRQYELRYYINKRRIQKMRKSTANTGTILRSHTQGY